VSEEDDFGQSDADSAADSPGEASHHQIAGPGDEIFEIPAVLPLIPVRDVVVYPGVTVPLAIGRRKSLAALAHAGHDGFILLATQRDPDTQDPGLDDLHTVGTIIRVLRIIDGQGEGKQALVAGVSRARIERLMTLEPQVLVRVTPLPDRPLVGATDEANWRRVVMLAQRVIELREDLPDEWKMFLAGIPTAGMLADIVSSNLPLVPEQRVRLLEESDPAVRLRIVESHLEREVTIAETQQSLRGDAGEEETDPKRREKMLRSRMREIQAEIGEGDAGLREVDELRERFDQLDLPEEVEEQADRELKRLTALPQHAPDRHMIRTYLEWILDLPWNEETTDKLDLADARRVLDDDHHGLDKVKERVLEFLAVRKLAPDAKAPILCFVGPPGVGKTSLGRSIARAMQRKFARASLGGVRDEAEIRGHRRTYVGAMPGRVMQSLKRAGTRNPVFVLDEIDKLGSDFRGDPSSALLEVLDPEQNSAFSDHYIEVPFDLSKVLFIATANTLSTIPPALLDRMEVIELTGYTEREKLSICKQYLVGKQLDAHGLTSERVVVHDAALEMVVLEYTNEAGVRNLERHIATLMRKVAFRIASNPDAETRIEIDKAFVGESLGAPPHMHERAERTSVAGTAVGLAVTAHGGEILFVEARRMAGGKGVRLRLTGQLGDVMRESAEAALSWVRAHASEVGLHPDALEPCEIHLHLPAGAVPKDGPSAGIAMITAIVSALSDRRSTGTIAMTGEISLRGKVLPVGGIKGKILAAARAGIETIVMPRRNEKDLIDVPEDVIEKLDIHLVTEIDEALRATLPAQS
jgi:ATP-dependent Lon protease